MTAPKLSHEEIRRLIQRVAGDKRRNLVPYQIIEQLLAELETVIAQKDAWKAAATTLSLSDQRVAVEAARQLDPDSAPESETGADEELSPHEEFAGTEWANLHGDRFGRCSHDKVECPGCHQVGCWECESCACEVGS